MRSFSQCYNLPGELRAVVARVGCERRARGGERARVLPEEPAGGRLLLRLRPPDAARPLG